ncbi:MAG: hypothetical protein ACXW2P_05170 [Thermoanaerobaculia bacterium]
MPLFANADTRTYAGGFSTRWNTTGWHGHDQELCPEAASGGPESCNDADFRNANLDNSIGFRFGHERDWFDRGPLKFLAGVEGAFTDSEYNLSQDHIAFFSASAIAGIDYEVHATRIGGRLGAGPFMTSDGRGGAQAFAEVAATIPIRPGAGLRFGHRFVGHASPAIKRGETSILLVASPGSTGASRWEFAATAGTSSPDSLNLRAAAYQRMAAMYYLGRDLQLQASWTATAHESTALTTFMGYPGNERGKTIESFGLALRHRHRLTDSLSLHYSGGMELADWADEHHLLPVTAGTESGFTGAASIRFALARHAALEGGVERIWWRGLDLNETRWGIGLVLTR